MKFNRYGLVPMIVAVLFMAIGVSSCSDDETDSDAESVAKVTIDKVSSNEGNYSVSLLADEDLFSGYNKLYVAVRKASDDTEVDGASVSFVPTMHMTDMTHRAPVENPDSTVDADGYYEGAIVFLMPSNDSEYWTLDVAVDDGEVQDTATFDLDVAEPDEAKIVSYISPVDDLSYFVTLVNPTDPIVGLNDLEFTVHRQDSYTSYTAVDDLDFSFSPAMPSMGHSSPNNVDPVSEGDGHYEGTVNFTMTGWWQLYLSIVQDNQDVADSLTYNVTF